MSASSEVVVDFRMKLKIPAGYLPCIVGSAPELGSWDPLNAEHMRRNKSNDQEWHVKVTFRRRSELLYYRFFVCKNLSDVNQKLQSKDSIESDEHSATGIIIYKWEQQIDSRSINLRELPPICVLPIVDFGWTIDQQQGSPIECLVNVMELRLRLVGDNPIRFFDANSKPGVVEIKCCPIDCKDLMKNVNTDFSHLGPEVNNDSTMMRFLAISGIPVRAFRKLIGPKGIPYCQEYQSPSLTATTEISVYRMNSTGIYEFVPQQLNLIHFQNGQFLSYHVYTTTQNTLGLRFEFYKNVRGFRRFFAASFLLPFGKEQSFKLLRTPIYGLDASCLGEMTIDCLIVKPYAEQMISKKVSQQKLWKYRRSQGTGSAKDAPYFQKYLKLVSLKENTIASLKAASQTDVNFIELSVQLSKDKVPVIYHDFHALVSSYNKVCKAPEVYQIAVSDLRLAKLQSATLNKYSTAVRSLPDVNLDVTDLKPFPTLASVLRTASPSVGFLIVVKYPQQLENGMLELENYFDQNMTVESILSCVLKNTSTINIIFSSCHADTCIMLQQKQNTFPVLFRCMAKIYECRPYYDFRVKSQEAAVCFAASEKLFGVNLPADELTKDPEVIKKAHNLGLAVFVWTDSNDFNKSVYRTHVDSYVSGHIQFSLAQGAEREVFHLSKRKEDPDFPKTNVMTGINRCWDTQVLNSLASPYRVQATALKVDTEYQPTWNTSNCPTGSQRVPTTEAPGEDNCPANPHKTPATALRVHTGCQQIPASLHLIPATSCKYTQQDISNCLHVPTCCKQMAACAHMVPENKEPG